MFRNTAVAVTNEGILVRCRGGPLDGFCLRVPSLDDTFTIHPEDNFGRRGSMAERMRQMHRYNLVSRVTVDGIPVYWHAGVVQK